MFFAMIGISAATSVVSFILLGWLMPKWSLRRTIFVASAMFPVLSWLHVFVTDIYAAIYHAYHPDTPFMGGVWIIGIPLVGIGFIVGFFAILGLRVLQHGLLAILGKFKG